MKSDSSAHYEVECIIGKKISSKGGPQYLIKWSGYPLVESTWEIYQNLECPRAIAKFEEMLQLERECGKSYEFFEREGLAILLDHVKHVFKDTKMFDTSSNLPKSQDKKQDVYIDISSIFDQEHPVADIIDSITDTNGRRYYCVNKSDGMWVWAPATHLPITRDVVQSYEHKLFKKQRDLIARNSSRYRSTNAVATNTNSHTFKVAPVSRVSSNPDPPRFRSARLNGIFGRRNSNHSTTSGPPDILVDTTIDSPVSRPAKYPGKASLLLPSIEIPIVPVDELVDKSEDRAAVNALSFGSNTCLDYIESRLKRNPTPRLLGLSALDFQDDVQVCTVCQSTDFEGGVIDESNGHYNGNNTYKSSNILNSCSKCGLTIHPFCFSHTAIKPLAKDEASQSIGPFSINFSISNKKSQEWECIYCKLWGDLDIVEIYTARPGEGASDDADWEAIKHDVLSNPNDTVSQNTLNSLCKYQFLTRFAFHSFRHLAWIPFIYIYNSRFSLIKHYFKDLKGSAPPPKAQVIKDEWTTVDRIYNVETFSRRNATSRKELFVKEVKRLEKNWDNANPNDPLSNPYKNLNSGLYSETRHLFVKWGGLDIGQSTWDSCPDPFTQPKEYAVWSKHYQRWKLKLLIETQKTPKADEPASNSVSGVESPVSKLWFLNKSNIQSPKILPLTLAYLKKILSVPRQFQSNMVLHGADEQNVLALAVHYIAAIYCSRIPDNMLQKVTTNPTMLTTCKYAAFPFLVICSESSLSLWTSAFQRYHPYLIVEPFFGYASSLELQGKYGIMSYANYPLKRHTKSERDLSCHVVVCSYDALSNPTGQKFLNSIPKNWECVIFSGNSLSTNYTPEYLSMIKKIKTNRRLMLTNKTLENGSRSELEFIARFVDTVDTRDTAGQEHTGPVANGLNETSLRNLISLHSIQIPSDIGTRSSIFDEMFVGIQMSTLQEKSLQDLFLKKASMLKSIQKTITDLLKSNTNLSDMEFSIVDKAKNLLEGIIASAKSLTNLPNQSHTSAVSPISLNLQDLCTANVKMMLLKNIFEEIKTRKFRVLLLASTHSSLDIIGKLLDDVGMSHEGTDGKTIAYDSHILLNDSEDPISKSQVILANINTVPGDDFGLSDIDIVIVYDQCWDLNVNMCASRWLNINDGRRKTKLLKLLIHGSVEESIVRYEPNTATLDSDDASKSPVFSGKETLTKVSELMAILQFGAKGLLENTPIDPSLSHGMQYNNRDVSQLFAHLLKNHIPISKHNSIHCWSKPFYPGNHDGIFIEIQKSRPNYIDDPNFWSQLVNSIRNRKFSLETPKKRYYSSIDSKSETRNGLKRVRSNRDLNSSGDGVYVNPGDLVGMPSKKKQEIRDQEPDPYEDLISQFKGILNKLSYGNFTKASQPENIFDIDIQELKTKPLTNCLASVDADNENRCIICDSSKHNNTFCPMILHSLFPKIMRNLFKGKTLEDSPGLIEIREWYYAQMHAFYYDSALSQASTHIRPDIPQNTEASDHTALSLDNDTTNAPTQFGTALSDHAVDPQETTQHTNPPSTLVDLTSSPIVKPDLDSPSIEFTPSLVNVSENTQEHKNGPEVSEPATAPQEDDNEPRFTASEWRHFMKTQYQKLLESGLVPQPSEHPHSQQVPSDDSTGHQSTYQQNDMPSTHIANPQANTVSPVQTAASPTQPAEFVAPQPTGIHMMNNQQPLEMPVQNPQSYQPPIPTAANIQYTNMPVANTVVFSRGYMVPSAHIQSVPLVAQFAPQPMPNVLPQPFIGYQQAFAQQPYMFVNPSVPGQQPQMFVNPSVSGQQPQMFVGSNVPQQQHQYTMPPETNQNSQGYSDTFQIGNVKICPLCLSSSHHQNQCANRFNYNVLKQQHSIVSKQAMPASIKVELLSIITKYINEAARLRSN
ncbi:hypothetical protein H4219_000455 [Mycoemilia scoparia]|uniref:Chromo domain-containing protein n=1 Tax=Mycoemilia scoparia TaxID=417184 RepID=A0A9W8A2V3_9FUNG|nr:hypothetical protein H4219_000455 [Mycoemilia scoparia]